MFSTWAVNARKGLRNPFSKEGMKSAGLTGDPLGLFEEEKMPKIPEPYGPRNRGWYTPAKQRKSTAKTVLRDE